MVVPKYYANYSTNTFMLSASALGARIGITRFFPSIVNNSAAIKYGTLTEKDKELYRVIFYRRTLTKSMFNEVLTIKENAKKVDQKSTIDLPILLFTSNGQGTGWDEDVWIRVQNSYLEKGSARQGIQLDCEHYIHNIEYERIAVDSIKFINSVINTSNILTY